MEALLSHLFPGHPQLPRETPRSETVSVPGTSLAPPLSGPYADGLPFPSAGYCVAQYARKIRRHGDNSAGGTIPRLVEGSDGGYPAGNLRPHQRGPCRHQPGTETGDQEDPRPPTTPHPTPNPNPPAAAPLSDAIAVPTARPHEAGGDVNREVGSRTTEPPLSLQRKHSGTTSGDMEQNCAAEEITGSIRDGGSLMAHSGRPALPPGAHPPRCRGHGDGSCLSHQGPGRGGGRTQHLPVNRTLSLDGFRGGATH